jgi:hypothetical protein
VAGQQGSSADPFDGPRGSEEPVLLSVENNDFRDATIIAHWNGVRDRVGMVTGKTTETFSMRWRSELIQLEIDFVGGAGYLTESIDVWAGDHLNYVIMPGR